MKTKPTNQQIIEQAKRGGDTSGITLECSICHRHFYRNLPLKPKQIILYGQVVCTSIDCQIKAKDQAGESFREKKRQRKTQ